MAVLITGTTVGAGLVIVFPVTNGVTVAVVVAGFAGGYLPNFLRSIGLR